MVSSFCRALHTLNLECNIGVKRKLVEDVPHRTVFIFNRCNCIRNDHITEQERVLARRITADIEADRQEMRFLVTEIEALRQRFGIAVHEMVTVA